MNHYKILFSQQALQDLNEAVLGVIYNKKGLGKRLIADIKSIVSSIKQNPHFASVKIENIRTAACKPFLMQFIMILMKQII